MGRIFQLDGIRPLCKGRKTASDPLLIASLKAEVAVRRFLSSKQVIDDKKTLLDDAMAVLKGCAETMYTDLVAQEPEREILLVRFLARQGRLDEALDVADGPVKAKEARRRLKPHRS